MRGRRRTRRRPSGSIRSVVYLGPDTRLHRRARRRRGARRHPAEPRHLVDGGARSRQGKAVRLIWKRQHNSRDRRQQEEEQHEIPVVVRRGGKPRHRRRRVFERRDRRAPAAPSVAPASVTPSAAGSVAPPSVEPSSNLPTAIGAGEGELNIIVWAGYARTARTSRNTTGSTRSMTANPAAKVERQAGRHVGRDGHADAGRRRRAIRRRLGVGRRDEPLIARGDVAPVNVDLIPTSRTSSPVLKSPAHNTVDGVHYGVPHGWGANTLMWRTDRRTPAPTSWDVVFDPATSRPYKGKVTAYDCPIYIADAAALPHEDAQPELGITDPYALDADPVRRRGRPAEGPARPSSASTGHGYTDEIDGLHQRRRRSSARPGRTRPNTLKAVRRRGRRVMPERGRRRAGPTPG